MNSYDEHLTPLLRACSDADLMPVRDTILRTFTNCLDVDEAYLQAPDCPSSYVDELIAEIRRFGGNTLANIARNGGVPYAQIARAAAEKAGAKCASDATVEEVEWAVIANALDRAVAKLSAGERAALEVEFERAGFDGVDLGGDEALSARLAGARIRAGSFGAYRAVVIVAGAFARALLGAEAEVPAHAALARAIGAIAAPVGAVASPLWALVHLGGPAYRVTIPVVAQVGFLRLQQQFAEQVVAPSQVMVAPQPRVSWSGHDAVSGADW